MITDYLCGTAREEREDERSTETYETEKAETKLKSIDKFRRNQHEE